MFKSMAAFGGHIVDFKSNYVNRGVILLKLQPYRRNCRAIPALRAGARDLRENLGPAPAPARRTVLRTNFGAFRANKANKFRSRRCL